MEQGSRQWDSTGGESRDNGRYRKRARLDGGGVADHRQQYGGLKQHTIEEEVEFKCIEREGRILISREY